MPTLPLYQVDAFTDRPFAGNPAAVCPLEGWLEDDLLQAIALENNLSETAYFVAREGEVGHYDLRWFTPVREVDLCGHATLASAFTLFRCLDFAGEALTFHTRSGALVVRQDDAGRMVLDLPSLPGRAIAAPAELLAGLKAAPLEVHRADESVNGGNYMALYPDQASVAALEPDQGQLARLEGFGVIATAPAEDPEVDFVSRYFAACAGIAEDPVTGSAHCTLTPYWAARLGKEALEARQISARGGALSCRLRGDRVEVAGHGVLVLQGELLLP